MIGVAPVFQLPYNYRTRQFRMLWHQTLSTVLRYPELPRRVINFDLYPIFSRRTTTTKTLTSSVVTTHTRTIEDTDITEIWPAEDLSMKAGFFYSLAKIYNAPLASGNYLVWYPKDKTDKAFAILPLSLACGSEDEMEVNPVHSISEKDYRWLPSEVRFKFKILKIVDIPEAILTLERT